ncbi:hypothetical protein N7280_03765 [Rickettsia rhipicephali]|nr:hypothetical protein [Rickettsia rhipicephali]MCX4079741.1 hypothetical protein [Rickettsia rhipicephali]
MNRTIIISTLKKQQLHILSHNITSWNIPEKGYIKNTEATYIVNIKVK